MLTYKNDKPRPDEPGRLQDAVRVVTAAFRTHLRFITESPLQQLGGARELSSTLRYKLLPHMSMAAVKPSLSSPPPPRHPPPGRANHQNGRCSRLTCEFSIASGLEPMPSGWDTISRGISKRASGFNAHHAATTHPTHFVHVRTFLI